MYNKKGRGKKSKLYWREREWASCSVYIIIIRTHYLRVSMCEFFGACSRNAKKMRSKNAYYYSCYYHYDNIVIYMWMYDRNGHGSDVGLLSLAKWNFFLASANTRVHYVHAYEGFLFRLFVFTLSGMSAKKRTFFFWLDDAPEVIVFFFGYEYKYIPA